MDKTSYFDTPTPGPIPFTSSKELGKLFTALALAQGQMKHAVTNKMGHFGAYSDISAVWDACREALTGMDLCVTQLPSMHKTEEGAVHVTVKQILGHSSGQWLSNSLTLPMTDKLNPQEVGKTIAYAKRYLLGALVGVTSGDEDDDSDSQAKKGGDVGRQVDDSEITVKPEDLKTLDGLFAGTDSLELHVFLSQLNQKDQSVLLGVYYNDLKYVKKGAKGRTAEALKAMMNEGATALKNLEMQISDCKEQDDQAGLQQLMEESSVDAWKMAGGSVHQK